MMRFRVDEDRVSAEFVEFALQSPALRGRLQRAAAGTSGSMVKITKPTVERLPMPLPPGDEQARIVAATAAAGHEVRALEQSMLASERTLSAIRNTLLTGTL